MNTPFNADNSLIQKGRDEVTAEIIANPIKTIWEAIWDNQALHNSIGVLETSKATISKYRDLIALEEQNVERAEISIATIKWINTNNEQVKLNRHKVSPEHRVVKAIEKWRAEAESRNDKEFIETLDSMTVISEDEMQLKDWTTVKLGYPEITPDNEEIFERTVKDTEGKEMRAVYFKNRNSWALKKYLEEMKKEWFRIPWHEKDKDWEIRTKEFKRIFSLIVPEWTPDRNNALIELLWRAFSGYCGTGWGWDDTSDEEGFWSCSHTSDEDDAHYCYLKRRNGSPNFFNGSREYGLGVLLFKDKSSD